METLEELQTRHRKEQKDLVAQTTALKKSVKSGAGNKKLKNEVTAKIATMTDELEKRHALELSQFNEKSAQTSNVPETDETPVPENVENVQIPESTEKKKSRQQIRKEKKAAEMEEIIRQAREEAGTAPNMREIEDNAISNIITPMKLLVKQITPDGHCLYNAISDQLSFSNLDAKSYKELRALAAEYMKNHVDDFLPFASKENGDMYSNEEFLEHCDEIENTALWGGQLEIQALSHSFKRSIHIIQMGSPILKIGEEYSALGEPLLLSYHRHAYGLGEHYNSLRKSES